MSHPLTPRRALLLAAALALVSPLALAQSSWPTKPVTLIVPVKGYDEGLRENLAALAALDYPDYELIVAAHAAGFDRVVAKSALTERAPELVEELTA